MESQGSGHSGLMSPSIWNEDQKTSSASWPLDAEVNSTNKLEELTTVTFQAGTTTVECSSQDLKSLYDINQNSVTPAKKSFAVNGNGSDDKRKPSTASSTSADENHNDPTLTKTGVCAVCGDKASGKHYGQITCEGCKSFFKRSVRKDLHYSCRGSRDCAIDTQHRNQCQYCRLRKCVKAGMRKEAVQRGRVNQTSQLEYPCPLPQVSSAATILESGQAPRIIPHNYMSDILTILLRAEPFNHPEQSHIFPTGPAADMESVQQISQSLFYSIIEWMRRILPHFIDMSVQDQDALIHSSLSELFMMSLVQWYTQVNISSMFNVIVSYLRENNMSIESITYIHQQIEKLYRLRIDSAECSFIKAIIAFNPDNLSLSDPHSISTLQERLLSALEDYEKIYYNTQPNRFGKLLIRIPALKSISLTQIEQSFFCTDRKSSALGITGLIRNDMYAPTNNCWQPIPDHNMVNHSSNNS